jgi:hemin uptake protein HemP
VDEEERHEPRESDELGEEAVIDVTRWFTERREVCLELDGVRYRLRLTRRNKLILQK